MESRGGGIPKVGQVFFFVRSKTGCFFFAPPFFFLLIQWMMLAIDRSLQERCSVHAAVGSLVLPQDFFCGPKPPKKSKTRTWATLLEQTDQRQHCKTNTGGKPIGGGL